jgi:hypothetical protein
MPVSFDTHRLITRLTQGEMSLAQAEAVSDALQQALEDSIGPLATKEDVAHVTTKLNWMFGVTWGLLLLIVGKLLLFKP